MGVRHVGKGDADLAGAARPVDFLGDQSDPPRRRVGDARQADGRRHAVGEAGQRLFRRVGLEVDRAVDDDAVERLAGAGGRRAELGRAAADEAGDRRRHFGAPDAHLEFLTLGVAGLAVGLGDAERVARPGELSLSRLQRRLALLDGRNGHHPARQLLGALEVVARPFHLRLRLGDVAFRLLDRCVGPFDRCVVPGEQRVELGPVEAGQHLAGLDPVAVLGVELHDRQPVDAGGDQSLLARHERAGDEQPVDERAPLGRRHRDGGRRRRGGGASAAEAEAIDPGQDATPTGRPKRPDLLDRGGARLKRRIAPGGADQDGERQQGRQEAGHGREFLLAGREGPGEQRLQHAVRHGGFGGSVEVGLDRHPLEEAGDEGENEPRGKARIERRRRDAGRLGRIDEPLDRLEHVGVHDAQQFLHARVPAGLRPDLDDHARLLRRLGEHVVAKALPHRLSDVVPLGEQRGHSDRAPFLVKRAQALDDRLLGGKVAVEVAGAHLGLLGDMLHRRRMEAVADEGALGRLEDPLAPALLGAAPVAERGCLSTYRSHENEHSFS